MSIYSLEYPGKQRKTPFNIELDDPSLNGSGGSSLQNHFNLSKDELNRIFLSRNNISYILEYIDKKKIPFRFVTHPQHTNTCYQKAQMLGNWNPLNIIKALYFECSVEKCLYAVVAPETGCFFNKSYLSSLLQLSRGVTLAKAKELPVNMTYGTCSPFIDPSDLIKNNGKVSKILFDTETLIAKKRTTSLDDFSFGIDHRISVQINYYHCYKMLKTFFGDIVDARELLTLSFKEKFIRKKGKIRIEYNFESINYQTAEFVNKIHGVGDVYVENDYIDELDLPEVLTSSQ